MGPAATGPRRLPLWRPPARRGVGARQDRATPMVGARKARDAHMDQILQTTLSSLWPLLALLAGLSLLAAALRHPRVKGWWGEWQVRRLIRQGLDPHRYVDLHNVTLPIEGGSTQIDHLIFSPYGLFVLETKNMKGWIFGGERQAEWTQKIHKHHSQKFQNPLRQNHLHVQAVQALLQLPKEQVHSVVAFVGPSQFKTEMPPQVLQGRAFIGYIQQFQQQIWEPDAMQTLIDQLEQQRLAPTRATQKAHVAHVQRKRANKAAKPAPAVGPVAQPPALAGAEPVAARRGAPTPQQMAAAPLLQEVVAVHSPAMAPRPSPPVAEGAAPRPARVCPQCQSALGRLRLQRGPLAGQVIYRCSNTSLCQYVQPLPAQAPVTA